MTIFDSVKGTVNAAVDTISAVTQTIVEKNRTNAKLNRLRLVMKSESELMNRAYIALGKTYYDSEKRQESVTEKLLTVRMIFFMGHPNHTSTILPKLLT